MALPLFSPTFSLRSLRLSTERFYGAALGYDLFGAMAGVAYAGVARVKAFRRLRLCVTPSPRIEEAPVCQLKCQAPARAEETTRHSQTVSAPAQFPCETDFPSGRIRSACLRV